jgi:hypothetical protein
VQLVASEPPPAPGYYRYAPEIKYRIACRGKATFNNKTFTGKSGLNLKKKVVKRYILSVVLYGAECWTLRKGNKMTGRGV